MNHATPPATSNHAAHTQLACQHWAQASHPPGKERVAQQTPRAARSWERKRQPLTLRVRYYGIND